MTKVQRAFHLTIENQKNKQMKLKKIQSLHHLQENLHNHQRTFLLLYKEGAETSMKAIEAYRKAAGKEGRLNVLFTNVAEVRDIHPRYSISTAPALLEFDSDSLKNVYKGAQPESFYEALFDNAIYVAESEKSGKPVKRVTVYSTPTCSWCNTLKSYLRQHRVQFTDIDVSRDAVAARELVRKTGQQGVPQTDINGEMIVGFDKSKINRLLEIKEHV